MNEAHFSALLSAHFMAPRPEEAILFILLRNVDHPEESDKNDLHEVTLCRKQPIAHSTLGQNQDFFTH